MDGAILNPIRNNELPRPGISGGISRGTSVLGNNDSLPPNRSTIPRLNGKRQPSPRLVIPLTNGNQPINLSSSSNPEIAILEEKAKNDSSPNLEIEDSTVLLTNSSEGTDIIDMPKKDHPIINSSNSMPQSSENGLNSPPIITPMAEVSVDNQSQVIQASVMVPSHTSSTPMTATPVPNTPQSIPASIPTPQQAAQNASGLADSQKSPPQPHNFTPVSIQNMLKHPGYYSHIPDYDSMPKEEQYRFRTQFQTEFGRLRKSWPTYEIPLISDMPLRMVHVTYEVFCRAIAVYNKVDEYKFYIAVILLTMEVILVKFMNWPVKDLTQLLWKAMPFLEKYLYEMAENYYTGGGGSWSPEANLIYYGCIFAVFIIGFKVIASSVLSQKTMEWIVDIVTQFIGGLSSIPQTTSTGNNVASLPVIGHSLAGFGVDSFANTAPGLINSFMPNIGGNNNNTNPAPQPQSNTATRATRGFYDE